VSSNTCERFDCPLSPFANLKHFPIRPLSLYSSNHHGLADRKFASFYEPFTSDEAVAKMILVSPILIQCSQTAKAAY
jgi:hypothetical protein